MSRDAALLQVDGVSKSFGALAALTDVSLTVSTGEVVSVIGPNGAGKSTLFNVITGLHGPTRGRVLFNGHVITGRSPEAVNRLGLAKTFQITNVFPGISVYENVRVAAQSRAPEAGRFTSLWRRPDVEGWMLANLAEALASQRRYAEVSEICTHALEHVPHDHSFWWHRRYLAEVALSEGRWAQARSLCEMSIDQYHGVRLAVHQIDLVAELHMTSWWRRWRVFRLRLREMFRRYDAACREAPSKRPSSLHPLWLLRANPGPLALLLLCGRPGARLLRMLYGL